MEVSSKEGEVEVHSRKGDISCSTSSAGLLTGKARLAVIEEGDPSITDDEALLTLKAAPVRHRRTQSHCPPLAQLTNANDIKPKICHR